MRTRITVVLVACVLGAAYGTSGAQVGKWTSLVDPSMISDMMLKDGELYIASSGGLLIFDPADSTVDRFDNTTGIPANFLTCMTFALDGGLWVGTNNAGLARLDQRGGGFGVTPLNSTFHGLVDDRITSITTWGDTIAYGTPNGAGLVIEGFAGARFQMDQGLPSNNVADVMGDGNFV